MTEIQLWAHRKIFFRVLNNDQVKKGKEKKRAFRILQTQPFYKNQCFSSDIFPQKILKPRILFRANYLHLASIVSAWDYVKTCIIRPLKRLVDIFRHVLNYHVVNWLLFDKRFAFCLILLTSKTPTKWATGGVSAFFKSQIEKLHQVIKKNMIWKYWNKSEQNPGYLPLRRLHHRFIKVKYGSEHNCR